ncbi:MAG: peptide chain release factor N(5)-glutamine methyltransferase [Candidatus Omnitrophica bacterium]|nr:peptide chain release factor N(5)-glutamine methyltransferase [Candidatus Omnitrophota bacterium]
MTEAELVFTHVMQCDRAALYLDRGRMLDKAVSGRLSDVLRRRADGEPLAYILGTQEFMGFEFLVNDSVLVPRMETEILVETAVRYSSGALRHRRTGFKILDLGTGSGNIAVSLARLVPEAGIDALDISEGALSVARKNARLNEAAHRIRFIRRDMFNDCPDLRPEGYSFIVSNPPYIPSGEIARLQPEVRREPRIALDGGADGLDFYRRIVEVSPGYLKEHGLLVMEIGFGQREAVAGIFEENKNFELEEVVKDYSGIERVVVAQRRTNSHTINRG